MKKLSDILKNIVTIEVTGELDYSVSNISFDSRNIAEGDLFVAVKGTNVDGHDYIDLAIDKGAKCIVYEDEPLNFKKNLTYIKVNNSAQALGKLVSNYYNNPSKKLKLIGITGTNGKTTTVTLLYHIFTNIGYKSGLISTVKNYIGNKIYKATHTTPDAVQINSLLNEMVKEGCDYCFMEVSSHAIDQERISGLSFAGGMFTNITHDHLDYHKTFKEYLYAKKRFFDDLPESSFALVNVDDKNSGVLIQNAKASKFKYALKSVADYKCSVIESHLGGMHLKIEGKDLWTKFIGQFNAYNLLAVYSVARLLGQDKDTILKVISTLSPVEGRFEVIRSKNGRIAIVDYAHTPDALDNVLKTIKQIKKVNENIITVVGAGGNRDKRKRPEMARIAVNLSDKVILTSDNPRNEDPEDIIKDMEAGVGDSNNFKVLSITDRREAIKTACMMAQKDDIILIAGKGHETYQEIKGVRYDFDDKKVVLEIFKN